MGDITQFVALPFDVTKDGLVPGERVQFFRLRMRVSLGFGHEPALSFLQREITLLAFVALQRILDSFLLL